MKFTNTKNNKIPSFLINFPLTEDPIYLGGVPWLNPFIWVSYRHWIGAKRSRTWGRQHQHQFPISC